MHGKNFLKDTDDAKGRTALSLACQYGHKDIVQLLLNRENANIDLNSKDNNGWTAFMLACEKGHKDIVKIILAHQSSKNIDFNAKVEVEYELELWGSIGKNSEDTALMMASKHGHKDVVNLILHVDHPKSQNIDFLISNL